MKHPPKVIVCAGGGGVGKTTTSAALASAAVGRGKRVLVITIDPARRLADALGVELGPEVQPVNRGAAPSDDRGAFFALMPDPRQAMRTFVEYLFDGKPRSLARVLDNRMYKVMEDAIPGVHELAAMALLTRALERDGLEVDVVVIDTAPSRNAVDFITYPKRLAELLEGRAMRWLAQLANRADGDESDQGDDMKPQGRVMKLLAKALGPAVHDVGVLSGELVGVIDRFTLLNQDASRLLMGPDTRYLLVAAPTRAATDDAVFLYDRLGKLSIRPQAAILNGGGEQAAAWEALQEDQLTPALSQAVELLREERLERVEATEITQERLGRLDFRRGVMALPFLGPVPPERIVAELAERLEPHLGALLG